MNGQWYYAAQSQQMGPVGQAEFDSLVASGVVQDDTLVWREGMSNWEPYRSVKPPVVAAAAVGAPAPQAAAPSAEIGFCSECGTPYEFSEMVRFGNAWVCANCKELFAQRLRESGPRSGTMQYAGFWIRVLARIIDAVLLSIVYLPFGAALGALFIPILQRGGSIGSGSEGIIAGIFGFQMVLIGLQLIGNAIYEIFFVYKYSATPGKMLVGKKIVNADGSKLSLNKAIARHFANYLNSFTLGIGYIMVALDEEKRGLHDRICDTRVVAK
jgi:uncharacterized RDD family membrane protein YckC